MAEAVGFEPTRRLITVLAHFKCAPFNLLGTPPYYLAGEQATLTSSDIACLCPSLIGLSYVVRPPQLLGVRSLLGSIDSAYIAHSSIILPRRTTSIL